MLVSAAIIALFVGPVLWELLAMRRTLLERVERVLIWLLAAGLLILVVPELFREAGAVSLIWIAVGFALPAGIETAWRRATGLSHHLFSAIAALGIGIHALIDGAALVIGKDLLPWAVVVHRLVVGIVLWLVMEPTWGRFASYTVLAALGVATLIGYFSAQSLVPLIRFEYLEILQALIVGMLMHGIIHQHEDEHHAH